MQSTEYKGYTIYGSAGHFIIETLDGFFRGSAQSVVKAKAYINLYIKQEQN